MKKETIKFEDSETGQQFSIEVEKTVTANGQTWKIGTTRNGIDWAVPVGFPNNHHPICREVEPVAFERLAKR